MKNKTKTTPALLTPNRFPTITEACSFYSEEGISTDKPAQRRLAGDLRRLDRVERTHAQAVGACNALVAAYAKGLRNGGSVDWSDLDHAHAMAVIALRLNKRESK